MRFVGKRGGEKSSAGKKEREKTQEVAPTDALPPVTQGAPPPLRLLIYRTLTWRGKNCIPGPCPGPQKEQPRDSRLHGGGPCHSGISLPAETRLRLHKAFPSCFAKCPPMHSLDLALSPHSFNSGGTDLGAAAQVGFPLISYQPCHLSGLFLHL